MAKRASTKRFSAAPETVYPGDRGEANEKRLFRELGLRSVRLALWEERYVGRTVFTNGAWLKIWLICAPALAWRFEIYSPENEHRYVLSTGCGPQLTDYWPMLKQLLNEMVVVTATIEEKAAPERALSRKPVELTKILRDEDVFW